jgi:pilus assembly protein Flp/PilA
MMTFKLLTQLTGKFAAIGRDKRGQDLIEYALLAGFVAVAAGAIFPTTLTPNISQIFSKIGSILNQA